MSPVWSCDQVLTRLFIASCRTRLPTKAAAGVPGVDRGSRGSRIHDSPTTGANQIQHGFQKNVVNKVFWSQSCKLMQQSDGWIRLSAAPAGDAGRKAPVYLSRWGRTAGGDGSWGYCSHNVPPAQVTRSRMLFLLLLHFFVRWRRAATVDRHGGEWINLRFPLNKSRTWD